MNLDDLLKDIWTAEESQAMEGTTAPGVGNAGLQRQGSFTLSRDPEEVWRNLLYPAQAAAAPAAAVVPQQQHQHRHGGDHLGGVPSHAGVIKEEPAAILPPRLMGDAINSSSNRTKTIGNVHFGNLPVVSNAAGFSLGFSRESAGNLKGCPCRLGKARMSSGLISGAVALDAGAVTVTIASPVNYVLWRRCLREDRGGGLRTESQLLVRAPGSSYRTATSTSVVDGTANVGRSKLKLIPIDGDGQLSEHDLIPFTLLRSPSLPEPLQSQGGTNEEQPRTRDGICDSVCTIQDTLLRHLCVVCIVSDPLLLLYIVTWFNFRGETETIKSADDLASFVEYNK
ncbi:hypothetical protein ZIOFF_017632 [Zingiber officinale]|uniref:Uncharacterized protein n=1 Tax=Zingiber officinale TaxID=94328 RepID=A0A8J5LPP6_ZINOF|nr:hypothetical protein ZIOFF_017632 [Zingiber officinale]